MEVLREWKNEKLPLLIRSIAVLLGTTIISVIFIFLTVSVATKNIENVNWPSAFVGSIFGQVTILMFLSVRKQYEIIKSDIAKSAKADKDEKEDRNNS